MRMRTGLQVSWMVLATTLALSAVAADAGYKVAKTWKLGGDGGWD
jgi:hypothetical protein